MRGGPLTQRHVPGFRVSDRQLRLFLGEELKCLIHSSCADII